MTNPSGITQATMGNLLEQELRACEQLKQLLDAEQKAITEHDIPAFEAVIDRKRLLQERFYKYEQERIVLLDASGIKHGTGNMNEYIKMCHDVRLSGLWQRLLSMAASCRDHNRKNHQLVELFSAHTNKALRVLRGEAMEQHVYGPDGDSSDPHENRSLGIV